MSDAQVETPNADNATLTNSNVNVQESLGGSNSEHQLTERSQISNEIQVWTQIFEQKNNDRIVKTKEESDNKFEAILNEIWTNKSASSITNPWFEMNETQNTQPSGSKND